MKLCSLVLSACLLAAVNFSHAEGLKPGDYVAVCGDSITEQKLYSLFIEDYLLMCQPEPNLSVSQFGWSGETSWGFLDRVKNDVLPFQPTVATTCYGMNDGAYAALTPEIADKYRKTMQGIVDTLKAGGVRFIVVGGPGAVDFDTFKRTNVTAEVYNKTLADLSAIAKEIAEKNRTAFADVHGAMIEAMKLAKQKYGNTYAVAGPSDGVHPAPNGHVVMAYAFLKALGCSGDIGTITYDAALQGASASTGHKVLSASQGNVEVESSKYPFCFYGEPSEPYATSGIIEFTPFNQDLNRFMLVVKNAKAPKYKVTWGADSKEFSAEQLAKGINLAAEFIDNPFSGAFAAGETAIKAQQTFETPATKVMMHSLLEWRKNYPEEEAQYARFAEKVLKTDEQLRAASRAAIVPVKHTIVIEEVKPAA